MEKISEIFKSLNTYLNILLGVAGVSIAMLLAPNVKNYNKALDELYTLKKISLKQYETFVEQQAHSGSQSYYYPGNDSIPYFAAADKIIKERYPNLKLRPAVRGFINAYPSVANYLKPRKDGNLEDWLQWLQSEEDAKCYTPNWNSFSYIQTMPNILYEDTSYLQIRHLSIKKALNTISGGLRVRFYLDNIITDTVVANYDALEWFNHIDTISYEELVKNRFATDSSSNIKHYIIEGLIFSDTTFTLGSSSVSKWLRNSKYWKHISSTDSLGDLILPECHSIWTDLSNKNADNAIEYLTYKRDNSKTVSLIGIDISFTFALFIIPLAYLLILIFLFIHVQYLNSNISSTTAEVVFPWIALYNTGLSRITELMIFLIIPTLTSVGLICRFNAFVPFYVVILSIFFTLMETIPAISILRANNKSRNLIRKSGNLKRHK